MSRKDAKQKAEALVAQMTTEEVIRQLHFVSPAIERLGVPAYNWWNETLHGVARAGTATSFPQAIGMAASFDRDLVEKLGDVAATEGRAKYNADSKRGDRDIYKGLTFWSPNVNLFRDPRWGRGHETYGEDPYLTGETGKAYVRGLQGDGETMKAAACAKHFAVHSGPEDLRHQFNAVVSEKDLRESYLPAFKELVTNAKVEIVMGAYNRTDDEPCCGSQKLLVDILRGEWGFDGHVTSDAWAVNDFFEGHKVTASHTESAALALSKGCDTNCGRVYDGYLKEAYEKGMVTEEQIRRAAVHLFTTRYRLGILDGSEYDSIPFTAVECPEHLEAAQKAARESCVLLKNDGTLPLKNIKTLGVIGPNANSRVSLIGNYHGTSSRYITVLEGLQDAMPDTRILYSEGCHLYKDRVEPLAQPDDRLAEALTVAENSDAVVLVVGLDETLEGEEGDTGNANASGDKNDLLLPESQRKLMDAVLALGRPTVICLMAGSAIDIGSAAEKANAVLLTWYPGARGGKAVADLLLGRVSPSGKLPVTFYYNEQLELMPPFTDYSMRGRTYRYFPEEPLYPFGYGLTYGDVYAKELKLERDAQGGVTAKITLHNAGTFDTQDVAQLYVQNEGSVNAPANPRLCGYARVDCPAGADVTVCLCVKAEQLLVVNEKGEFVAEGAPVFYAGTSQPDSRSEALTGHKPLCARPD